MIRLLCFGMLATLAFCETPAQAQEQQVSCRVVGRYDPVRASLLRWNASADSGVHQPLAHIGLPQVDSAVIRPITDPEVCDAAAVTLDRVEGYAVMRPVSVYRWPPLLVVDWVHPGCNSESMLVTVFDSTWTKRGILGVAPVPRWPCLPDAPVR